MPGYIAGHVPGLWYPSCPTKRRSREMPQGGKVGIVLDRNFIVATRDTGYKSTASAISELVDNALEAGADDIQIAIAEVVGKDINKIRVTVLDNGCGMTLQEMRLALQFGGTSRFNQRVAQGRFGMGLPNSSVSQARRVDVFSWRKQNRINHTYLDVDEIASGFVSKLHPPRQKKLPEWFLGKIPKTGTLVIWDKCDKLDYRKASTMAEKLRRPIGRWFRYFLWRNVRIQVNGVSVKPVDPLFPKSGEIDTPAVPFGRPLQYELRVPGSLSQTSMVKVKFALLQVSRLHSLPVEEKRRLGIVKGAGVSIVRAGREIDFGWHFMGSKRKENYDDWWRAEVGFEPALDECFGVTHSKQGINPTAQLRTILEPDMESIGRRLNSLVRSEFIEVKRKMQEYASARRAEKGDRYLEPPDKPEEEVRKSRESNKNRRKIGRKLSIKGLRYRIQKMPMDDLSFFVPHLSNGELKIVLNQEHPFFECLYPRLGGTQDNKPIDFKTALELLIIAYARAEVSVVRNIGKQQIQQLRESWSNNLAAFLS